MTPKTHEWDKNRKIQANPIKAMRMHSHSNQESLIGLRYHCTPKNFLSEPIPPGEIPPSPALQPFWGASGTAAGGSFFRSSSMTAGNALANIRT